MATIKDVAQKCGFSICTVSRALSGKGYLKEETRAKIMAAVEELNYHPNALAANLKTGRRQTLALVLPSLTNVSYAKLETYMEAYAAEKDYILQLHNTEYDINKEMRVIDTLLNIDIGGVIIAPVSARHDHIMKLADANIPYVYLNHFFNDDSAHCLCLDNRTASYEAVSHMIKLGHTNIGGVFQSPDNSSCQEQYEGMMRAFQEHHLTHSTDNILFDIHPENMESANVLLRFLSKANRPEAVFACNDMIAFHLYRAAYILGIRIPEQLSIFGYDDSIMANYVTPPLSSVSIPNRRIASLAIEYIHHYQETGEYLELPVQKASLVIRDSVKNLTYKK